jgi:hypothetical protein
MMVLPLLALMYMLGEKQNFSYRHISTCALTFHASSFISSIYRLIGLVIISKMGKSIAMEIVGIIGGIGREPGLANYPAVAWVRP